MDQLTNVCPIKLNDSYSAIYDLQHKLGIDDDYLTSTLTRKDDDIKHKESLVKLLESLKNARDDLFVWYMKQSIIELNVMISLITARIKFIEFKLGQCDGFDLHQSCSLSLVNFCNILADMTVLNVKRSERKTMHIISKQTGVPVWLSHYRNQICHVPSESPCISILVPLVEKALVYMKDSFWSNILDRESFDAHKCKIAIATILGTKNISSINQNFKLSVNVNIDSNEYRVAKSDHEKSVKACSILRKLLKNSPEQVIEIVIDRFKTQHPTDRTRNCFLLLEQVILARCFENFVIGLLSAAESHPTDRNIISWLSRMVILLSIPRKEGVRRALKKLNLWVSVKMIKLVQMPSIKCCQIAFRMTKMDHSIVGKLIRKMRYKLVPVLGKDKTILLLQLTKMVRN